MNAYSRIGVRLGTLASAALGGFAVEQTTRSGQAAGLLRQRDRCKQSGWLRQGISPQGERDHQGARRPFDSGGRGGGKRRSGGCCRR